MNPTAIYSKTGKGVQEASGRTNHLSRADRAVLSAIDGKSTLSELIQKFEKIGETKFLQLIDKMDKDGFVREVSPGAPAAIRPRPVMGAGRTGIGPAIPPPPPKQEEAQDGGELDFTSFIPTAPRAASTTPKARPSPGSTTSQRIDLAAQSHAEAQRKAQEQAFDFKAREQADAKAKEEAAARAKEEAAARAKAEAEAKAKAEAAAKEKAEALARARAAAEARARADADAKSKVEAEAKARSDSDAKSKALRDAAIRAASEARQKAEAEAKAKAEAEERANKEAEERARIEQEMNAKLDAERKARVEAERNAKDQAERLAKEAEERARREVEEKARQESDQLRQQLETERKAREDAERKAREEEERRRKEVDEAKRKEAEERQRREAEEAKRKDEEERRRKEAEEERKRKEAEAARRKAEDDAKRETEEAIQRQTAEAARRKDADDAKRRADEEAKRRTEEAAKAAPAVSALADDLLADLDSFAKRDEEEQKARETEERRVREDAERKAKEAEARKRKEEESQRLRDAEARRREEAQARARAEAEARAEREREEQEQEAVEKRRRQLEEAASLSVRPDEEDDIDISEDDLDLDEIRQEERVLSKSARKAEAKQSLEDAAAVPAAPAEKKKKESKVLSLLQKIKQARARREKAPKPAKAPKVAKAKPVAPKEVQAKRIRRRKFGKPLAVAALLLLAAGVGVLHVMPVPTGGYESAASASLGVPVRISSAGLSLVTGVQVKLEGVTIGSGAEAIKVVRVRAYPSIDALISSEMAFSKIELEGARVPQMLLAQALLGGLQGGALRADSVVLQDARFEGPLTLPPLNVTLRISPQGRVTRASVLGPDGIEAMLTPKGKEIAVDAKADALTLPFLKGVTLADVAFKGSATREALRLSAWDARLFDGVISGTAELRWGREWSLRGDLVSKGVNAAVFAPALLSEGKADGKGRFGMSGSDPKALAQNAQLEGAFTINKGVLGSFDLSRAIQTRGKQSTGRTLFSELSGEGIYQRGAVALRNLNMGAGKLNAAGNIDIAASGELQGRVVADVESGPRAINETFNLVGTVKEPRLAAPTR